MEIIDNIKTLLNAGAAGMSPEIGYGGTPYVVIPEGYKLADLEHLLPNPRRKRAEVATADADSFIQYSKKHGSLDNCTVYAELKSEASQLNLVAVINDHGSDLEDAQWRDHRCLFRPVLSVEWSRWLVKNKVTFNQGDFATWLEDNLPDIANAPNMPSGADILQMALNFEATRDKRFHSKTNLQSGGSQFTYVDDDTKETKASMKVFERFTLGIPVFDGSKNAYPVEARLKYREMERRLVFWYELIRQDRVFKSAVADELVKIKEATGFPIIFGKP
ncbi:MAG: YfdQ family protein [Desulfobulbus sp.]|nr:YfdQ family protein [Desulfobulbus sp.]